MNIENYDEITAANKELVFDLATNVPAVQRLFDDHLEAFGELIPHVLFGEITSWAVEAANENQTSPDLATLLSLLEKAYVDRPLVRNILLVSFLENMGPESFVDGLGPKLRLTSLLGPVLAAEGTRFWNLAPGKPFDEFEAPN